MPDSISVCIANYNGESVIHRCLASVLSQQVVADVEILVHDDASSDRSVALITQEFPDVHLLVSEENVGFCRSNNRLVDIATGDYILLLNNDAWLEPDALATLLSAANRDVGHIFTLPQYDAQSGELLDCGMFMDIFANPVPIAETRHAAVATAMGACLWVPKSLWLDCGGLPEWFGSIGEDMYLCCHARILGRQVIALDQSGYHHEVGMSFGGGKVVAGGLSTRLSRRRLSERNKTFCICLFYPGLAVWVVLPVHLVVLLAEGLLLAAVKRKWRVFSQIYGHAIGECIRNAPLLYRERQRIQRQRSTSVKQYFSVTRFIPYKLSMLIKYGIPSVN